MPGTPVALREIAAHLRAVWEQAADAAEGDPWTRLTLSNLILVSFAGGDQCPCVLPSTLIEDLAETYPSRFFGVELLDSSSSARAAQVSASVNSRCLRVRSGSHVCTEEVYLRAGIDKTADVLSLLRSHLLADIPTVVLLACDPGCCSFRAAEEKRNDLYCFLAELTELSDVLTFDSRTFGNFSQVSGELRGIVAGGDPFDSLAVSHLESGERPLVRDINWRRLERWRTMVAESFDGEQLGDPRESVTRVVVCGEHSKEGLPAELWLLAGWIGNALGWEPRERRAQGDDLEVACVGTDGNDRSLVFRGEAMDRARVASGVRVSSVEMLLKLPDGRDASLEFSPCEPFDEGRVQVRTCLNEKECFSAFVRSRPEPLAELLRSVVKTELPDRLFLQAWDCAYAFSQHG